MATDQGVTRPTGEGTIATLICGKPECDQAATRIIEFGWNGWAGVLGSCVDHHEDLLLLAHRSRTAGGED
jgi:hypothetical protein